MLICANLNQPWNSPLPTVLLLQKCKSSNDVNQIHARLITTGFIRNRIITTKIVLAFSPSPFTPLVDFARFVFFKHIAFRSPEHHGEDPFLWNAVIKSYSHGRDARQAFVILRLMLENGVPLDKFSLSLVLKACSRLGLVKKGMQVHGLLRKLDFGSDLFLQNSLISLYVRCGFIGYARQLFDRMSTRDSVSYNSMIDGYIKRGVIDSARELFDSMPLGDKNLITWNSMISGYTQLKNGMDLALELFDKMPDRDLISWNSMINGFVKCGNMEDAQDLFDKMPKRDVVSWADMINGYAKIGKIDLARSLFNEMPERDVVVCNAMMAGYVQNGYCAEALEIFYHLQRDGHLQPDSTTLLIALSAIAQLGLIDKGLALNHYLKQKKFSMGGRLGVALIDMYSKCGSIKNAASVFEGTEFKTVDHWNAMIGGLAIHGMGELAFNLLMDMERLSVEPDDITYIGVLNACGHAGLVKEGLICFDIMRRVHKVVPKLQHYGCVVNILGRAGLVNEARKFIEEMPIKANDVIWRSLLSACKNHDNINVAEPAAKRLITLDSCNSSSYVLLSNMYAGLGMWNSVSRVRLMMKERDLKKIPGCSWIELEGTVHEFFVQDKSHPQVMEIYSLLDSFSASNSRVAPCMLLN
ncbi:Pentatricopeptide repeat-containing protein [Hibiscus syriacus]|uniref:Pentatricopeptide repeat-containing protein n=1 Tax=Hibiscus syriacus TaxID=106335 RepID=A0A6A3D525_HIBSY|nr:pentatricopeptide repeat-containing protein At2g45350, chloroplastic-like [Hibiscus syriacus]KAE8734461.1 Pentatricopeptide repeat-containing protein [Hibiscus syriacus]